MKRIFVSGPSVTEKEIAYVKDAALHAWLENANMYNERFERAFAEYVGVKHAVSLPSCTSAIHLSLLAKNIQPGDEVIVPDITWIASSAPISYVGATPVFADVDPEHWCLDPDSVQQRITEKTRAIIAVDLYGNMPNLPAIREIADKYDLTIIEDAAEAFGSELNKRKAGSFGETGVFSFHGSKTMTTGEGGMLVTSDGDLFRRVLFLRDHGRMPGDRTFRNTEVAFKYKMSSLQAAFGLAQLERAEELIARKREIFYWYKKRLGGISSLKLNPEIATGRNSFWMVTVIFKDASADDKFTVMQRMSDQGIDCRPFFSPLSSLEAYDNLSKTTNYKRLNPVSYEISKYGINLPSGLNLSEEDVDYCCNCFRRIIGV